MLDPGKKISKKIAKKIKKLKKKTTFRHYFLPNRDEIGRERKKKFLVPNSVPTRDGLPFPKAKTKKFKKLKNIISTLFLYKPG